MKNYWIIICAGILFCLAANGVADVNYDFVNQDGEVDQKVGPMVRQICNLIVGTGLGLCIIAVGIGACQWFAWFLPEDKNKGAGKFKNGMIGIFVFGMFWSLMATLFKIAGIN